MLRSVERASPPCPCSGVLAPGLPGLAGSIAVSPLPTLHERRCPQSPPTQASSDCGSEEGRDQGSLVQPLSVPTWGWASRMRELWLMATLSFCPAVSLLVPLLFPTFPSHPRLCSSPAVVLPGSLALSDAPVTLPSISSDPPPPGRISPHSAT